MRLIVDGRLSTDRLRIVTSARKACTISDEPVLPTSGTSMTSVAPPRPSRRADPPSPVARRQDRPRWRDTRLLVGLMLVLLSVVVGARVLAGADDTDAWVSTRAALPAGHVLTDADLATASARLGDASSVRYYRVSSRAALLGRPLAAPVGAGGLLPADAVAAGKGPPPRGGPAGIP